MSVLFLFLASNEAFTFNAPSSVAVRPFSMSTFAEKRSDRAYIENSLENMMDNDWRVFRAQLVAQEKRDAEIMEAKGGRGSRSKASGSGSGSSSDSSTGNGSHSHPHKDEKLARQGQLGELFAGAISSIFNKPSSSNGSGNSGKSARDKDIFDGDSIGRYSGSNRDLLKCEDPFVSEQEIPSVLPQPSVTIDKRRWAHEIPHVEPGCVLIANEKLGGVFHQTVVLIVQHSETAGSTGIVINRYVRSNKDLLVVHIHGGSQSIALLTLRCSFLAFGLGLVRLPP
jgi:putative transcriptional regulator